MDLPILSFQPSHKSYMQDESQATGWAEFIAIPTSVEQLSQVVADCAQKGRPITVQGAHTGVVGGGVPNGGLLLSMAELNGCVAVGETVTVEAGVTLEALSQFIRKETGDKRWFPLFPTEQTATIGGAIASGAGGIYSHGYGNIRDYVVSLTVVNGAGDVEIWEGDHPLLSKALTMEGQFGIIAQVTLKLVPKLPYRCGLLFFFPEEGSAFDFVEGVPALEGVVALEYLDGRTLSLIRQFAPNLPASQALLEEERVAVLVEVHHQEEETLEETLMVLVEQCADPDSAWCMSTDEELSRLHGLRHSASESVNLLVAQHHANHGEITKLSLDVQWGDGHWRQAVELYRQALESSGLDGCVFGHIGGGSPYLNVCAKNPAEYQQGQALFATLLTQGYERGAVAFCEQGIGKVKRSLYQQTAPQSLQEKRQELRNQYDENRLFGEGLPCV